MWFKQPMPRTAEVQIRLLKALVLWESDWSVVTSKLPRTDSLPNVWGEEWDESQIEMSPK